MSYLLPNIETPREVADRLRSQGVTKEVVLSLLQQATVPSEWQWLADVAELLPAAPVATA